MFANLKKLDIDSKKTSIYTIVEITGSPKLIVKPATEVNKPYYNQILKRAKRNSRSIQAGGINSDMLESNRDEDRALFPKYVITGWENVNNDEGKAVDFNEANCKAFLEALPDWIFDGVRDYCASPSNFLDIPDAEEVAKN